MIKRIVEIGQRAYCSVAHNQLIVKNSEAETVIPIEDLGVLILNSQHSTYSHGAIAQCVGSNVTVIVCNEKHLPCGVFLPFECNTLQSKYMALQLQVQLPTKKRLWQSIVRAKIRAQARALESCGQDGAILCAIAGKVRSGDPDNCEACAARHYWKALYGKDFRRDRKGGGANPLLNYGYAIVRATLARAITAAGLHPSFGLHHHHQNNAFCLVDDLIEPLRPLVDKAVYNIIQTYDPTPELSPDIKRALLELLVHKITIQKSATSFMIGLHQYATSLRRVFAKEAKTLTIPVV